MCAVILRPGSTSAHIIDVQKYGRDAYEGILESCQCKSDEFWADIDGAIHLYRTLFNVLLQPS